MSYQVVLQRESKPTKKKPKRKVWMLLHRGDNGLRQREVIGDTKTISKHDADIARSEKEHRLNVGDIPADKPGNIVLKDFFADDNKRQRLDNKPQSLMKDESCARLVLKVLGNEIKLAAVGDETVQRLKQAWLAPKNSKPVKRTTVKSRFSSLRAIFGRAVKRKLIHRNPFKEIKIGKSQPKDKRIYTHAEHSAMLETAPNIWWKTFIMLGYTTGLRLGELLNLTWADIDFDAGIVKVQAKHADDKHRDLLEWSCKSHLNRQVPLTDGAAHLLRKLKMASGRSPYLFLSLERIAALRAAIDKKTGQPKYPPGIEINNASLINNYLRTFRAIQVGARAILAERLGVELDDVEWCIGCVHDLRASYGTHNANAGMPMHELQRLMGHADISTTAKYYLNPSKDTAAQVRETFAACG